MKKMEQEQIFLRAYDEYADAMFRYCFFRVSDRERAKDISQETFIKTWEYIADGKEIGNIRALLYRIAANLVTDYYRKKKEFSLDVLRDEGFDPAGENMEETIGRQMEYQQALETLSLIDERSREALYLRYVGDLSVREIAAMIGESENVVSVRIHRGKKKLKDAIGAPNKGHPQRKSSEPPSSE